MSDVLYISAYFPLPFMPVPDDGFMKKPKHVAGYGE
jgi:hypothetical protein